MDNFFCLPNLGNSQKGAHYTVVRDCPWLVLRGRAVWGQLGSQGILPTVPPAADPF